MTVVGPNGTTITVEFSPTTAPFATPVWVDITSDVLFSSGVRTRRGRSSSLDEFVAGTAQFTLKNQSRDYDPGYVDGPYYGNLLPMRRFRITATYGDGVVRDSDGLPVLDSDGSPVLDGSETAVGLFAGFITDWPQEYDEADAVPTVPVALVDGFEMIASGKMPSSVLDEAIRALSPVHYWPMDERSATNAIADAVGSADGSTMDEPRFGEAPLFDGLRTSIDFDGTNDRIDLSDAPLLPDPFHCTVVAVVAPDSSGAAGLIRPIYVETAGNDPSFDTSLNLHIDANGKLQFIYIVDGYPFAFATESTVFADGPHLVMAQSNVNFATDYGVAVDSATLETGTTDGYFQGGRGAAIGGMPNAARGYDDNHFDGRISNVAIWDNATLTLAQRQTLVDAIDAWAGDTTDVRLGRILDYIGWPAGDRALDAGQTTLGAAFADSLESDPLNYLHRLTASEQGQLFVAGDGALTLHSRSRRLIETRSTTSQATFGEAGSSGELPYQAGIRIERSRDTVRNEVTVKLASGEVASSSDSTSQTAYGTRSHSIATLAPSPVDAKSVAEYVVSRYKDVQARIPQVTLVAHRPPQSGDTWTATTMMEAALGLEISDRVTVKRRPGGGTAIELTELVEGVEHTFDTTRWETTFNLSPADTKVFAIWGSAVWGTALWGY